MACFGQGGWRKLSEKVIFKLISEECEIFRERTFLVHPGVQGVMAPPGAFSLCQSSQPEGVTAPSVHAQA